MEIFEFIATNYHPLNYFILCLKGTHICIKADFFLVFVTQLVIIVNQNTVAAIPEDIKKKKTSCQ
jgi:hypothetical protein